MIWNRSPTRPMSATSKIGASLSLLMATMVRASLMPVRCWIAPEMPPAACRSGAMPFQAGLNGKRTAPALYDAGGASGGQLHPIGLKEARILVALHIDRPAPLLRVA